MPEPGTTEQVEQSGDRLAAVLEKLNTTLAEQKAQPAPQPAPSPTPEPKKDAPPVYTAEQLQEAVEAGKITQARATEYLLQQERRLAEEQRQKERAEDQKALADQQRLGARIDQYAAALPDLRQKGSDAFKRFESAYQDLISDGEPDSLKTQLRALQIEFGRDPAKLVEITETTKQRTVSTERSGSGASQSKTRQDDGKGPPAWLRASEEHLRIYQRGVETGRYKNGWQDEQLQNELKRLKPIIEARA